MTIHKADLFKPASLVLLQNPSIRVLYIPRPRQDEYPEGLLIVGMTIEEESQLTLPERQNLTAWARAKAEQIRASRPDLPMPVMIDLLKGRNSDDPQFLDET